MTELATSVEKSGLSGPQLAPDERVVAVFRPDLNQALRFAEGVVVVTTSRVWFRDEEGQGGELLRDEPIEVERREHAGVCELFLRRGPATARFRYTLAQARDAASLAEALGRAAEAVPEASGDEEEALPAVPSVRAPMLRLLALARPRRGIVVFALCLTVASTAVGLVPPYLTMPLVDEVLVPWQAQLAPGAEAGTQILLTYFGAFLLAAIVTWLLAWAQGAVLAWVSEVIAADLRNRTFAHLTRLSIGYFGGKRTGDLIARISSETDRLCSFLSDTLVDFITDVLMIVGTAIILFKLNGTLALAALISFPPIAYFMVKVRGSLTHGFLRSGRAWSYLTNILADTIPGIRVVKAFSQEAREIQRFEQANQRVVEVNNRNNRLWTSFWPLVVLLNSVGLLVVWAVGAYQVYHHAITVGGLTAAVAYVGRFYTRVESMSRMLGLAQRASAAAQRLFEILDRAPNASASRAGVALAKVEGELRFEHVSFRYGSRQVLNDVSFTVAPGKMLGIVGHTGSGKSTVANLVCRFYDATDGRVRLDGVDVTTMSVEQYRRHIGIVLQDSFLFFGTIGENVAYGAPDAPLGKVLEAARAARAHEFVLKLPEAYDSLVGERGQSLSGGERQRVAIARAILVDPQILVLDEATSAVDVQTEREIQRALDNVVAGRTTIAIAHRLSTLAKADLLLVLKDGKVVETGTHTELLALGGEYAKLQRTQQQQQPEPNEPVEAEVDVRSSYVEIETDAAIRVRWSTETDTLTLETESGELLVSARRCFPLSDPERFVSLVDGRGHERACVDAIASLEPESRAALTSALAAHELLPRIEQIESLRQAATQSIWGVRTERGPRRFVVEQEDHIRRLPDGRHLITDSHGMRYVLPQLDLLDARSRKLFLPFS